MRLCNLRHAQIRLSNVPETVLWRRQSWRATRCARHIGRAVEPVHYKQKRATQPDLRFYKLGRSLRQLVEGSFRYLNT